MTCTDGNVIDILAIIISVVSLIASGLLVYWEYKKSKEMNAVNLNAELYKDVVKEYLTIKFPGAIEELHFERDMFKGIEKLQNSLIDFRNELKFFKYIDLDFFITLKERLENLENYLVDNADMAFTYEEQDNIMINIGKSMTDIYTTVNRKYTNG